MTFGTFYVIVMLLVYVSGYIFIPYMTLNKLMVLLAAAVFWPATLMYFLYDEIRGNK